MRLLILLHMHGRNVRLPYAMLLLADQNVHECCERHTETFGKPTEVHLQAALAMQRAQELQPAEHHAADLERLMRRIPDTRAEALRVRSVLPSS